MNPDDYISAGYYITTYTEREINLLLPPKLIDFGCFGSFIPDTGWHQQKLEAFQIPVDQHPLLDDSLLKAFTDNQVGFAITWYDLASATQFVQAFKAIIYQPLLIGLGLPESLFATAQQEVMQRGFTREKNGFYEALFRQNPLQTGGKPLGYQVIGLGHGIEHSMYCYDSMITEWAAQHQILLNDLGLFTELEQAASVAEKADQESVGDCNWYPVLITEYSLDRI